MQIVNPKTKTNNSITIEAYSKRVFIFVSRILFRAKLLICLSIIILIRRIKANDKHG
jgi:hypothetical protein